MTKVSLTGCVVALFVLIASPIGKADSINTLQGWDGYTALDGVGETWGGSIFGARSLAETFKVDSQSRLNSMTFALRDNEDQRTKVDVVIMAWGGSAPQGSVLYRTGPVMPNANKTWTTMTVSLGNTLIQPNKDYIAIITTTPYMDSLQNNAMAAFAWDNYSGGSCWYHTAFGPNEELSTSMWSSAGAIDLGVDIKYTPVPEPMSLAILALGSLAIRRLRSSV